MSSRLFRKTLNEDSHSGILQQQVYALYVEAWALDAAKGHCVINHAWYGIPADAVDEYCKIQPKIVLMPLRVPLSKRMENNCLSSDQVLTLRCCRQYVHVHRLDGAANSKGKAQHKENFISAKNNSNSRMKLGLGLITNPTSTPEHHEQHHTCCAVTQLVVSVVVVDDSTNMPSVRGHCAPANVRALNALLRSRALRLRGGCASLNELSAI